MLNSTTTLSIILNLFKIDFPSLCSRSLSWPEEEEGPLSNVSAIYSNPAPSVSTETVAAGIHNALSRFVIFL